MKWICSTWIGQVLREIPALLLEVVLEGGEVADGSVGHT
jgi:hypothetical protein